MTAVVLWAERKLVVTYMSSRISMLLLYLLPPRAQLVISLRGSSKVFPSRRRIILCATARHFCSCGNAQ